ncbi:hypothetical protein RhiirA4_475040 [Rhizophagus irregularis]|uniref:Serine-threonine/tyrosine-protein kinase catalytic domain-containing protein n=1 Tax=Rhizophagus irregularis TaxID=588596 RepID=A0A2I1H9H0_9GLOM|nr:hypothetical protein RhiirA4_475040 [Rhizophagus irregularis]
MSLIWQATNFSIKTKSYSNEKWIIDPYVYGIEDINEWLKCDDMEIMEFINTPIGHNNLATKSHPQAYYTSHLLVFTIGKLNEILESDECLDCMINNMKSFDIIFLKDSNYSVIPKYDILLLRNEFFDIKGTPKSYLDLMIKCWDNSPINEIINIIEN